MFKSSGTHKIKGAFFLIQGKFIYFCFSDIVYRVIFQLLAL